MNDKKLYLKKKQAQLDEWKADLDKLKAKASGASADSQLELNQHIAALDGKIKEGKVKLDEVSDANDDAWESIKKGVESSWGALKSAFNDAKSKYK